MAGWKGFAEEDLEAASDHYRERDKREGVEATLAVFADETTLPTEPWGYMGEEWSANGCYTGGEWVGFFSDGVAAMAGKSQMDVPDVKVEDFEGLEEAIEWAQG